MNGCGTVFRQMLVREVGTAADSGAIGAAARRLCERWVEQASSLIGEAGVAALCARSLRQTEQLAGGPMPVDEAAAHHPPCALVQRAVERQDPAVAIETAAAVLAMASGLLATLIGEALTWRLLRDAWPDDFAGAVVIVRNTPT